MSTVSIATLNTTPSGDFNSDSSQMYGQTFEVENSSFLDSLEIDMKESGTTSGSFQFEIYDISGTYGSTAIPTGSVLATSDSFDSNTLTGSYVTYTINFSGANKIYMTSGSRYALVCNYNATSFPNAVYLKAKTPSYYGGNWAYKSSGTWTALSSYDGLFTLKGQTFNTGAAFLFTMI